jgi:TolB protein
MTRLGRLVAATLFVVASIVIADPGPAHSNARGGGAIVFTSDRDITVTPVDDEIYLIRPGSPRVHRLTDNVSVDQWPALSPDGRFLAWVKYPLNDAEQVVTTEAELYVCRLQYRRGHWACGTERALARVGTSQTAVAWTPDSKTVLYAALTEAGAFDIFSIKARGHHAPINLTNDAAVDNQPSLSPDGRWFVYGRQGDLYRRAIDGSDPVLITGGGGPADGIDVGPDYSPDGSRIAFQSNRDGDFDIYVIEARPESPSNVAVNLTDEFQGPAPEVRSQERRPTWSPDGRYLAFWWHLPSPNFPFVGGEIYRMRAHGTQFVNLTDNDDQLPIVGDIMPDWGGTTARHR